MLSDAALTAAWIETPLGPMLAVAGDRGLELLEFVDRRALETELRALRRLLGIVIVPGDHPALRQTREELSEYFAGKRRDFTIPLRLQGSDFQLKAWRALWRRKRGAQPP